jgi:hypothetical protein
MNLYENYFISWWDQLTPKIRWELEANKDFAHCKKVCQKEKDRDQFFYFMDKCKAFQPREFFTLDDIKKALTSFDKHSTEYKILSGLKPGYYKESCFERSLLIVATGRGF